MELKYPVMITLRQIRNAHPCESGWKKVIADNGGAKADLDAEFELASIIDSNGLDDCLWALRCKPEYHHIYRKFAVVCADAVARLIIDDRSTAALDVAWSHSCGEATDGQLASAWAAARDAARDAAWDAAWAASRDAARDAALAAARDAAWAAARDAAWDAALAAAWDAGLGAARDADLEYQSQILRHALTTGEVSRKCQKN